MPDAKAATASPQHRMLPCCDRFKNARFATYCPYCQIATAPPPSSSTSKQSKAAEAASAPSKDLLPPGLKAPPPYRRFGVVATMSADQPSDEAPPPYAPSTAAQTQTPTETSSSEKGVPILHYLDHDRDSIASLSLRYNVPADLLRQANRLTADHLLQARRVIQIPSLSGTTVASLSPQPVEREAEARRKAAIRRFMVACKVSDYDLAVLYLEQTGWRQTTDTDNNELEYDLRAAVEAYQADEQWEKTHPVEAAKQKAERQKKHKNSCSRVAGGFFSRRRS
ncbi:hypothetical protein Sste5344_009088 [Sporothrix stenoceras]